MRVAITSQAPHIDAELDPRFGRARYFIVADTQAGGWFSADNAVNLEAQQGAGIQAAKHVADLGAQALITGHVGPKAFAALEAAGIAVYTGASGDVAGILAQFQAGALTLAQHADAESHWV